MLRQITAACLLGTALATAPAFAQDAGSSAQNSGQFLTQMSGDQWRGSKLVGVDVYGSDNQKIGDINEVIIDRNGQAKAIVIGVGGFLGIGEKNVAIPWEKVQWNVGGDKSSGSMASNSGGSSSGTMAANSGGQPAGDRSTSKDIAQTTTGSPNDPNAQPPQPTSAGGATLSAAPSSGTNGNAPANSSPSVASTSTSSNPSGSSSGSSASSAASTSNQDYPDRALVSMSKQDLQNAPEFHYASQMSKGTGGSNSGGSMTGSTGSTSGR